MKKFLVVSAAFFYLLVSTGIVINMHYCGGELKHLSFFNDNSEEDCCGDEEMEADGCCKDETATVKIKDVHQASHYSVKSSLNYFKIITPNLSEMVANVLPATSEIIFPDYHGPPVLYSQSLYLKNRVFLI